MRRSIWTLSLAFATLLSTGSAYAAGLTVDFNGSRRVMLHGAAATVFVADPAVADVTMIDPHSLILLGKGYGVTQVLVTDLSGHTLMDARVAVVGSDAGRVTIYRGQAAQDYHCSSRCETINGGSAAGGGAIGAGAGGGDNAPMNVGSPVTVTPTHP
jgi:Pilus formation protein N terminal region